MLRLLSRRRGEILLSLLPMLSLLGRTPWRWRRERVVVRQVRAPSKRVSTILLVRTWLLLMASIGRIGTVLLLMRAVLLGWARMLLVTIMLTTTRLLLVRIVGMLGALLLVGAVRLTLPRLVLRAMLAWRRRAVRMRSSSRRC
jgi:hypothetical protein